MLARTLCTLLLFCTIPAWTQFTYVRDQSVLVQDLDGRPMRMPWTGGFNAVLFNRMDLNGDRLDDLVLFDRMTLRVLTFLSADSHYIHAPDYEAYFPAKLSDWVLLRDYDCDGRKDLFTREPLGIVVYKNMTPPSGLPQWRRTTKPVIFTKGSNGLLTNVLPASNDTPVIADIDGDGDLDVLNFRFVSPNTIAYHRNLSMEQYGSCDSLVFERITQRYGDVEECLCGIFGFEGNPCPPDGGRVQHTEGRSLLTLDVDGDNDLDLLFSEEECDRVYVLDNEGTNDNPVFTHAEIFPFAVPVLLTYPVCAYEDADFDGIPDLVVTSGLRTKNFGSVDLSRSVHLYANTGNAASPSFQYTTDNYLQHEMIDVGDNAVPAFFDADGDGDYDMFISNNDNPSFQATLRYYENTGAAGHPSFRLRDLDYAALSTLALINLKIQFADMNSDARVDLVFSGSDSQTGETSLFFMPNKSSAALDLDGQSTTVVHELAAVPTSDNVLVTDVTGDGSPDLLLGKSDGSLQFWRNTGTPGYPAFTLADDAFLGLAQSDTSRNLACAVCDLDADRRADLILGDASGRLVIIPDYRNSDGPHHTNLIFNGLSGAYTSMNLGGPVWPACADLFNTKRPAVIVGSNGGGVTLLRNDGGASLSEYPDIRIFPNPVYAGGAVTILPDRPVTMRLLSLVGREQGRPVLLPANQETIFDIPPHLTAGIYIATFSSGLRRFSRKIVIL